VNNTQLLLNSKVAWGSLVTCKFKVFEDLREQVRQTPTLLSAGVMLLYLLLSYFSNVLNLQRRI